MTPGPLPPAPACPMPPLMDRLAEHIATARKLLLSLEACVAQLRELTAKTRQTLEEAEALVAEVRSSADRWAEPPPDPD